MWQNWTNAVLGLALIVAASIGLDVVTLAWTAGILGAVIAIFGFWGAGSVSHSHDHGMRHA